MDHCKHCSKLKKYFRIQTLFKKKKEAAIDATKHTHTLMAYWHKITRLGCLSHSVNCEHCTSERSKAYMLEFERERERERRQSLNAQDQDWWFDHHHHHHSMWLFIWARQCNGIKDQSLSRSCVHIYSKKNWPIYSWNIVDYILLL